MYEKEVIPSIPQIILSIPWDIKETVEVLMVEIDKTKLSGFLCVS